MTVYTDTASASQVVKETNPAPIIELSQGAHGPGSRKACLMEWVSIFTDDPFGDHPACSNELLSDFARRTNDALGEAARQKLAPRISQLAGTATPKVHPKEFLPQAWAAAADYQYYVDGYGVPEAFRRYALSAAARVSGPLDQGQYDLVQAALHMLEATHDPNPDSRTWNRALQRIVFGAGAIGEARLIDALGAAINAWQAASGVSIKPLSDERLRELREKAEKLWKQSDAASSSF